MLENTSLDLPKMPSTEHSYFVWQQRSVLAEIGLVHCIEQVAVSAPPVLGSSMLECVAGSQGPMVGLAAALKEQAASLRKDFRSQAVVVMSQGMGVVVA